MISIQYGPLTIQISTFKKISREVLFIRAYIHILKMVVLSLSKELRFTHQFIYSNNLIDAMNAWKVFRGGGGENIIETYTSCMDDFRNLEVCAQRRVYFKTMRPVASMAVRVYIHINI